MAIALLALQLGGLLLLAANLWVGSRIFVEPTLYNTHFLLGLAGPLLAVFAQAMTLFYLLGSARGVGAAVEENALDEAYRRRTRRAIAGLGRVLAVSAPLVLAAPVLGGAAQNARLPGRLHAVVAWGATAAAVAAYVASVRSLAENYRVVREVNGVLERLDARAAAEA